MPGREKEGEESRFASCTPVLTSPPPQTPANVRAFRFQPWGSQLMTAGYPGRGKRILTSRSHRNAGVARGCPWGPARSSWPIPVRKARSRG